MDLMKPGRWLHLLTRLPQDAGRRDRSRREVFHGLRYVVKSGVPWCWMPNGLPEWTTLVDQQAQRWLAAGCFEAVAKDLRIVPCLATGGQARPCLALPFWTTGRCAPCRKAKPAPDMKVPSGRRVPSCTRQPARRITCRRCTPHAQAGRPARGRSRTAFKICRMEFPGVVSGRNCRSRV